MQNTFLTDFDYILATNDNRYVAKEVINGNDYTQHIRFALTYNTFEHAKNVADRVNEKNEKDGIPTRITNIFKREVTYTQIVWQKQFNTHKLHLILGAFFLSFLQKI